ncbi:MAG: ABC transporter ATP-binding protein [Candidatus Thermoplasmatota archaeon]|nr:ABC transporter ATP-binding protein [Candidatus Thermoplasmatota archaeon]
MSVIVKNLVLKFGDATAIDNLNMEIGDGEFAVILGPSGSGKTSFLRCLAGLLNYDSGEIEINGKSMNGVYPSDRNVAMVFQNYALYPHMTIYDNIALNLRMKGLEKSVIDMKVNDVSKVLGIDQLLKRRPREISGGQAQRVGLARAMVRDPAVYLMDEPLSNLDAKFREEMREELKRFHKITGKTIVYVTHDQTEAMSLADRIVVMDQGRKIQEGSPKTLYDNPEHAFVAGFVGTPPMNIFRMGTSGESGNFYELEEAESGTSFGIELSGKKDSRKILAGIRPSDLTLDPEGQLELILESTEFLGPTLNSYVRIGTSRISVAVPRTQHNEELLMNGKPGSKLRFRIAPDRIYLFDESSGERLSVSVRDVRTLPKKATEIPVE